MSLFRTLTTSSSRLLTKPLTSHHNRLITTLKTPYYTAEALSVGGRAGGNVKLINQEDGGSGGFGLDLKMGMPKGLGGNGKGNNPEELFALGYATCFNSALGAIYGSLKRSQPFPSTSSVDVKTSIGKPANDKPGFLLAVQISVSYDPLSSTGLNRQEVKELVEKAHQLCPYSAATRGNIEQEITVT